MMYTMHYDSPLGGILLAADEEGMTGLWFETQKYFAAKLAPEHEEKMNEAIAEVIRGKTVLVIAHRLHSIVNADQIWSRVLWPMWAPTRSCWAAARRTKSSGRLRRTAPNGA